MGSRGSEISKEDTKARHPSHWGAAIAAAALALTAAAAIAASALAAASLSSTIHAPVSATIAPTTAPTLSTPTLSTPIAPTLTSTISPTISAAALASALAPPRAMGTFQFLCGTHPLELTEAFAVVQA